jgi:acetyl-CoA carboxylase biotin carboxyl carrier protein
VKTKKTAQNHPMDLKEIKAIIELMSKNHLSEFDLEREGFKIRIKKSPETLPHITYTTPAPLPQPLPAPITSAAPAQPTPAATPVPAAEPLANLHEIASPMVGTFYRAPSPDSAPYVELGQKVTPDTVVCIIEAMKVMNEIKAETTGTIVEILVENGKSVEFGQPLFRVKPL